MSKIPSQQVVIVGIDANAKMGLEQQSDVLGKWYYAAERTSDNSDRLVDLCEPTGLITASTFKRNHRRHQLTWQGSTLLTPEEQRKRKMWTLKLQLDYTLTRNIPQSDMRKSRAVWDVAFDSDHRPVLLSFKIRFHKRNREVPLQPKIDMAGLKDDECRTKFRQRVSIHVGVRNRNKLSDADSFTKRIRDAARETLPLLFPQNFPFASAETKSTYNSACVACLIDDMNQRIAAVRTSAGCTTPFEVVTGVRQRACTSTIRTPLDRSRVQPFTFNFAIDYIMRRTVDLYPADIILAPSGPSLTDLEYADDVVTIAERSTKLPHVVNLVSKLAAAYGLRLRPDKCKQMWISSRPRTGISVDGQPIELVDEFCYLGCTLKNNGSYGRDVQQRCALATSAFNSLTKCLWSTLITK
ncbi:hypothetical protein RB195_019684 [Necator americanus]|uniref:Reverse transcriptase domain-containing protein n=1 Tax=Necator americanus TaxID=51031 RepID=A0ABR1CHJ8_NECAM